MNFDEISGRIFPWIKTAEPAPEEKDENGETIAVDLVVRPFMGDLVITFAVDTGEYFELLQQSDLPASMTADDLFVLAKKNMADQVEFNLTGTSYGGFGILAGGDHEAGALCLDFIWDYCAREIAKDLIVAAPARDCLFMAEADDTAQIEGLKTVATDIFENGDMPLTRTLFLFSAATREFSVYGAV
ncbi:MAG: hypothetical protein DELT_01192 [Desulfovibrio sp.]